jgi:hypothetical protein
MVESNTVLKRGSQGKWPVGYHHESGGSLLMFEFADREPINLLIPKEDARAIASVILQNDKDPPPKRFLQS